MSDKVHPRYQSLPKTATSSEVMASKYAAEISKTGNTEDDEEMMKYTEEWEEHFRREGLTISNRLIATLSEVTLLCKKNNKEELAGKLATTLVDSFQSVIRQHTSLSNVVSHLEALSENLFTGIDEIKKLGTDLQKALPRKKISVSKKSSRPIKQAEPIYDLSDSPEMMKHQPTTFSIPQEQAPGTSSAPPPQTMEHETTKEPENNLESEAMKQLRSSYRGYYSSDEFVAFDIIKQHQIVNYYVENVLGFKKDPEDKDPHVLSMIFDLVDKERVLAVCKKIKTGELDEALITDSVEEIVEAINKCGPAYGERTAEEVIVEGRSRLVIN
ncbi:phosphoprotein [Datura yellow vein nucleorhabdovirus]|uniref:Phosphoprotein n=1 Tax=Datura yellow vein nucleorhabdovirus TaxID=195059 RepID=A0A0F7LI32_9RHAB|nr:phosphoprotein [Datura yellow vein nucleorhabdovirus]AKH61402.1 phosphoprotein [Datura yellow vein nucleorhabdovirus]